MAKLDPAGRGPGPLVEGFSGTGFRAAGRLFAGGLLLTPMDAIDWAAPPLAALGEEALAPLLAIDPVPEFVLLGTGAALVRPPAALTGALEARDIGLEAMDSRAAARAWGLLRGEGRWIAAALMPLA